MIIVPIDRVVVRIKISDCISKMLLHTRKLGTYG